MKDLFVSNREHLTSFVFYDHFIPQLHSAFVSDPQVQLSLNMANVETIHPLVLPNLLNVGVLLKKHYGKSVPLHIPWKHRLLRFLNSMRVLDLIRERDIFALDERFLGGFDTSPSVRECSRTFCFDDVQMEKAEVECMLKAKYGILVAPFLGDNENVVRTFVRVLAELMHNACFHGRGGCYVTFWVSYKQGVFCSISDPGIGYRDSLAKNPEKLQGYSKKDLFKGDGLDHFRAILGAIFRQYDIDEHDIDEYDIAKYGVYDVLESVTRFSGTVRVHSVNTQAIFTKTSMNPLVSSRSHRVDAEDVRKIVSKFYDNYLIRSRETDARRSPLRTWDGRFAGVHVEFEIPPEGASR